MGVSAGNLYPVAPDVRVLFVCTSNICRSPTVEGVFADLLRHEGLADRVGTDSAAIWDGFVGSAPERRSVAHARRRGIDLSGLRARVVELGDYVSCDMVFGMEHAHVDAMRRECPPKYRDRVQLFMDLIPGRAGEELPDPYFGGPEGFELVLDLAELGASHLVERVRGQLP